MFCLSKSRLGHSQDVKGVCCQGEQIYSVSRDGTLRWDQSEILMSSNFLNSVAVGPQGNIAVAGNDGIIRVLDETRNIIYQAKGHTENVTSLHWNAQGTLFSSSWDKTARVWNGPECQIVIGGHSAAVWSVITMGVNILTASADKTIKLWKGSFNERTFYGHNDCVRGLAQISESTFVSCSNDGSLKVWNINGSCLYDLLGHTSFVYSVNVLPGEIIISSSEDRSVKVWKGLECIQSIPHPCTSVWCVCATESGDIVSGGSDGVVRVWSKDPAKRADKDAIDLYEASLSAQSIPSIQIGGTSSLQKIEALDQPGKDHQIITVRSASGIVEAHQWNPLASKWIKIGDVVDSAGTSQKQVYQGKEYDYVFEIDLGDSSPHLKLPYNATENPWTAATTFIAANELPHDYLNEIADFIIKNSQGATLGQSGRSDPMTGDNRYIPSGTALPVSQVVAPTSFHLPNKDFVLVKSANLKAISGKIISVNEELSKSPETLALCLDSNAMQTINNLFAKLQQPNQQVVSALACADVSKIAFSWPLEVRFPGLDLLRIIVSESFDISILTAEWMTSLSRAGGFLSLPKSGIPEKSAQTNIMLATRVMVNLFSCTSGQQFMYAHRIKVYEWTRAAIGIKNKGVTSTLVNLWSNYAVLLNQQETSEDETIFRISLMELILEFVTIAEMDVDCWVRAWLTLGTLFVSSSLAKQAAKAFDVTAMIQRDAQTQPALSELSAEITFLLK